jgi:oxygen-independent coproporphyrinogen-3 oxidase
VAACIAYVNIPGMSAVIKMLNHFPVFDASLIRRYDGHGPRYTSYPTAAEFTDEFGADAYASVARQTNEVPIPNSLSVYVHIPFCNTVCFYCGCNTVITKNRKKATTYLDYLFKEIEWQGPLYDRDREVVQLHLGGGTPTFLNSEQMSSLMAALSKSFTLSDAPSRDYSIELDPRSVDPEAVHHLADLGFNRFSIGVQDIDEKVQRAVNRIQPFALTRRIVDACRDVGANSVNVDLIYGLPEQCETGFIETLRRIIGDVQPDRLSIFNYAHLPERFKSQRQIDASTLPSPEEKLRILASTIDTLAAAGYVHIGMDHFALPHDSLAHAMHNGTLQRNFQGYSTHAGCDLVSMGVSAIGQPGNHYYQNAKTLDDYYAHIDAGALPVVRGLSLSEDDCIRAEVIQQLGCHYELDINALSKRFGIKFHNYFSQEVDQLRALECDGLVALKRDRWCVSAKGRLLIRNICGVFDRYRQPSESKAFSRLI